MCRATIYDARNNFSALVKTAENGEPVELTRHDKPVAVIIKYEDYEKKFKKKSFFERWEETRKKYADVFEDPTYEGLVIPKREAPDEEYEKKMAKLWEEE
ncbi:MAG: type II toxin-antitoxin system Phd/YefM family antitoxin [Treponema sp.]|nr:type II toxin-antitoxin system Phd/YefM family antitoxin [Treponema sp.]